MARTDAHDGDGVVVFVTVGTDHHRFDRLIGWIEHWAVAHRGAEVHVQHGTARAPDGTVSEEFLTPDQFHGLLHRATAVVCSGGPGAIMEARAAGTRPIVVPRRAELGEHVDNHQLAFGRFLAGRDLITLAEDEPALVDALDAVITDPGAYVIPNEAEQAAGIGRFGELVDALVWGSS